MADPIEEARRQTAAEAYEAHMRRVNHFGMAAAGAGIAQSDLPIPKPVDPKAPKPPNEALSRAIGVLTGQKGQTTSSGGM